MSRPVDTTVVYSIAECQDDRSVVCQVDFAQDNGLVCPEDDDGTLGRLVLLGLAAVHENRVTDESPILVEWL